jgi:hypothetical protein
VVEVRKLGGGEGVVVNTVMNLRVSQKAGEVD